MGRGRPVAYWRAACHSGSSGPGCCQVVSEVVI